MNKWMKTILILLGSAMLTRFIPMSYLFRTMDTMIHEFAHAVMTLFTSGSVLSIELNANHSGVTYSTMTSLWSAIFIGLAGYITASLTAVLLFYWMYKQWQKWGLVLLTTIALLMIILFVHQGYGVIWLAGFIVLNIIMLYLPPMIRNMYFGLLAFLTLEESVMGPLFLVIQSLLGKSAGDASNLARWTHVPTVFWALLFLAIALVCARSSLHLFLRSWKEPSHRERNN
ncbi:M50 family metallopeptidase [Paenibacillus sp. FA6]|uniref:M50 family metallopeptidase n=1 Tax=Paenibacillus sp. FA6 TaxID=3413029 RepID=UPI003F65949F